MAISELVIEIKPRFNIYLTYLLVKVGLAKYAFTISEPKVVRK